MNKKKLYICGLVSCLSLSCVLLAPMFDNNKDRNVLGFNCTHSGNHYAANDKHAEFWTCCNCHETFLSQPEIGTFVENSDSSMLGEIPLIARLEKSILNLPTTLSGLTTFEKVKHANLLYSLESNIFSLVETEQVKLSLDILNNKKEEYSSYISPIFGFNEKDIITPLADNQIISVTKTTNNDYGMMFDALFEENLPTKNHGMLLNNLNASFDQYESIAFIAINDLCAWGKAPNYGDKINFVNNYDETFTNGLPGYNEADGYGNGVGLISGTFNNRKTFKDPIIHYQNTWSANEADHAHLYFTGLFGVYSENFDNSATGVINQINKAVSLVISSNEIAAQATLLVNNARNNYEKLSQKAKSLVTNIEDLEMLEKTLANYTYMLETTKMDVKVGDGNEGYYNYSLSVSNNENYGEITHIKTTKAIESGISFVFNFSIGEEILKGYSKIIIFLRTPNLVSGIQGAIDCGTPYLSLPTGVFKDSWTSNLNQDIASSGQRLNNLRLLNIIPSWASEYGEIEFSSFVLIKDNTNYTDLY